MTARRTRGDMWGEPDDPFPHRQTTIHEREPEQKVVLYDHRGTPLTHPAKRLGFQPPVRVGVPQ